MISGPIAAAHHVAPVAAAKRRQPGRRLDRQVGVGAHHKWQHVGASQLGSLERRRQPRERVATPEVLLDAPHVEAD